MASRPSDTPDSDPSGTVDDGGVPRARVWFWGLLLLGLCLRSLDLFDPWSGEGFKSAFGTFTTGLFARNFAQYGLFESGGMPYYWRVELADGELLRGWYTHHPALQMIVTGATLKLFGVTEWATRLPFLLASIAAMFPLHALVRDAFGARAALIGHAAYAVLPLAAWYGDLPYADSVVIAMFAVAARHHLAWIRTGARGHVLWASVAIFVGGLMDWPIAFVLPGFGLHAAWLAWQRRGLGPLLVQVAYATALGAAIVLHRLHMQLVLPPSAVESEAESTLDWVTTLPVPLFEFIVGQLRHCERYLTWPGGILIVLASLALLRARAADGATKAVMFSLALAGPIYIGLFPARSWNHDFFIYMSLPFIAGAIGFVVDGALCSRASILAKGLVLPLALALVPFSGLRLAELLERNSSDLVAQVVAQPWCAELLGDERAIVLIPTGRGMHLPFYARAAMVLEVDRPAQVDAWVRRIETDIEPDRRVVLLLDATSAVAFPALRAHLLENVAPTLHDEVEGLEFGLFDLRAWRD